MASSTTVVPTGPTTVSQTVIPGSTSSLLSSGKTSNITSIVEPTQVIEKAPIIHERVRKEEVEEIQPIIHREYERTKVIRTTVPLYDKEIRTPVITENGLAATYSRSVHGNFPSEYQHLMNGSFVDGEVIRVEKEPLIIESTRHVIIEELRPVIYREIVYPAHVRGTYTHHEGTFNVDSSYRGLAHEVSRSLIQGDIHQGRGYGSERSIHPGFDHVIGEERYGHFGQPQHHLGGYGSEHHLGGYGQQNHFGGYGSEHLGGYPQHHLGGYEQDRGFSHPSQFGSHPFGSHPFGYGQEHHLGGYGSEHLGGYPQHHLGGYGSEHHLGGYGQDRGLSHPSQFGSHPFGYGQEHHLGGYGQEHHFGGYGPEHHLGGYGQDHGFSHPSQFGAHPFGYGQEHQQFGGFGHEFAGHGQDFTVFDHNRGLGGYPHDMQPMEWYHPSQGQQFGSHPFGYGQEHHLGGYGQHPFGGYGSEHHMGGYEQDRGFSHPSQFGDHQFGDDHFPEHFRNERRFDGKRDRQPWVEGHPKRQRRSQQISRNYTQ